jgi:uncharacterized membrane protein
MDNLFATYNLPTRRNGQNRERIFEIDFLRGFDVFLMVLVHFTYDMGPGVSDIFRSPEQYPNWVDAMNRLGSSIFFAITSPIGTYWGSDSVYTTLFPLEAIGAGLFVFICGISCSFAKSNFQRGIKLFYVAMIMTLVLSFFDYFAYHTVSGFLVLDGTKEAVSPYIIMGILHAMAIALLLYALFDHFFNQWWQTFLAAAVLCFFSAFSLWYGYPNGYMPSWGYSLGDFWKLLVGLARTGDDYFSPLLISAVLFLGATVGKTLYKEKKAYTPKWFPKKWASPFIFLGKHSLEVYVLHQVFLYLVLALILWSSGFRLAL